MSINDFFRKIALEAAEAAHTARKMVEDAEQAARADATSRLYTKCRGCQAGLARWIIANPAATVAEVEKAHHEVWEQCEPCSEEYLEYLEKQDDAYHEEMDRRAEEYELSKALEHGAIHCFNGDDDRWQNGGTK